MLNKKIVPWFAGSLMLALLGLMSFTNQGFAQDNATSSPDAPEAAVDAAVPADAPEEVATIDSGDTAWMIVATALVLFMTIPGLSLFYGGLVRSKNILSVLVQCFAITSIITVLWVLYGYSLALNTDGMKAGEVGYNAFVGALVKAVP